MLDTATKTIDRRPFADLANMDLGWLDTRHHFSFADFHQADRMGWGALRVWNDDAVAPGTGFPPHPHRDMEIITYVRSGAITHKDSLGNEGRTVAGDVQVMSTGTGVRHAEYNVDSETANFFQIWIVPREAGGAPSWGAKPFPKGDRAGRFATLASGFADEIAAGALPIRADARVLGATITAGATLTYEIGAGRHVYLVPATGALDIDGVRIDTRDGAALTGGQTVTLTAIADAEIVLVDSA